MTTENTEAYAFAMHLAEYDEDNALRYNIDCSDEYDFEKIELKGYLEKRTKYHALNMYTPTEHDWNEIPF